MNVISTYKNGNYTVMVGEDCSVVRMKKDTEYNPNTPEYIELKITSRCDKCCPWCYENTSTDGIHGDVIYDKAIDSFTVGTIVCITGGDIMKHPYLGELLAKLKHKGAIVSLSLSQQSFMDNIAAIKLLCELKYVNKLDVSVEIVTSEFLSSVKSFNYVSLSIVAGITPRTSIKAMFNYGVNLHIRGYKDMRRGKIYHTGDTGVLIDARIQWLKDNIDSIRSNFASVSFDDLACEQLGIDRKIPDSKFSLYIDCVKKRYAKSSDSSDKHIYSDETVENMFKALN